MSATTKVLATLAAAVVLPVVGLGAGTAQAYCPNEGASATYSFSNVVTSSRPTNLYSAYITGPGTITYNKTTTATVGASMDSNVSAEAGVVFAKASASIGVGVQASRSWSDGFSYTLSVPSGQTRRMRLREESRAFTVTKYRYDQYQCKYVFAYSSRPDAPRSTRVDRWVLEA